MTGHRRYKRNRNRNFEINAHAEVPVGNVNANNNNINNNNNNNRNVGQRFEDFHDMNIAEMLDDLERNPLGIGQGLWLIDNTFMFAFFGIVVALVLLMEESDKRLGITPEQKRARFRRRHRLHRHEWHEFLF